MLEIKKLDIIEAFPAGVGYNIGGPIQCVVSYRDQCAHKHTNMSLY